MNARPSDLPPYAAASEPVSSKALASEAQAVIEALAGRWTDWRRELGFEREASS